MKLNVRAFAVACGLIWGFGLFLLTWWVMLFEGATGETTIIGHLYRGYNISPVGSLVGLVWGFFRRTDRGRGSRMVVQCSCRPLAFAF
jgi:hypothetical protein